MTRAYETQLGKIGLTYPQYLVMIVLWEQDGLTLTNIGGKLFLDSGTLTPLLKRLEAAGLLGRARRAVDEREVEVRLTEKGRRLQKAAAGAREYIVCRLRSTEPEIERLRLELMSVIDILAEEPIAQARPKKSKSRKARPLAAVARS